MEIRIINPDTSNSMTACIGQAASRVAAAGQCSNGKTSPAVVAA